MKLELYFGWCSLIKSQRYHLQHITWLEKSQPISLIKGIMAIHHFLSSEIDYWKKLPVSRKNSLKKYEFTRKNFGWRKRIFWWYFFIISPNKIWKSKLYKEKILRTFSLRRKITTKREAYILPIQTLQAVLLLGLQWEGDVEWTIPCLCSPQIFQVLSFLAVQLDSNRILNNTLGFPTPI